MKMSYLDRYKSGETVAVWQELTQFPSLPKEMEQEALEVAMEFSRRAFFNLTKLKSALLLLGYEFEDLEYSLVPASAESAAYVDEFEANCGRLPVLYRSWCKVFCSVNFRQTRDQQMGVGDDRDLRVKGLGHNNRLLFWPLSECVDSILFPSPVCTLERPFLPTGGCATNNDLCGFEIPNYRFDDMYYNDGGGDVYFGEAVRMIFSSGGFPFWKYRADFRPDFDVSYLCAMPDYAGLMPELVELFVPL